MRLKIKLSEIQDLATNGKVFSRGKAYYQEGYVRELTYDPVERKISAHIIGDSGLDYYPSIIVNRKDRPIKVDCNCKAFQSYLGCCKHLVAIMLMAQTVDFDETIATSKPAREDSSPALDRSGGQARRGRTKGMALSSDSTPGIKPTPYGAESTKESTARQPHDHPLSATYNHSRENTMRFLRRIQVHHNAVYNLALAARTDTGEAEEGSEDMFSEHASPPGELHLRAVLELPSHSAEMTRLEFQIGSYEKSYKIKNCEEFLDAVINGQNLYFGKNLTYQPSWHFFDPPSRRILDWMIWLYTNDFEKTPFTYQPTCSVYKRQYMMLNSARLYEFFNDYLDQNPDFDLSIITRGNQPTAPDIQRGWPRAVFVLEPWIWQDEGKPAFDCYSLSLRDRQKETSTAEPLPVYNARTYSGSAQTRGVRLLSRDARMLLYDGTIYLTSDEHESVFSLLYTSLAEQSGASRLIFQEEDMSGLLNLILPFFDSDDQLFVDPALRDRIARSSMKTRIWLDREGGGISARVEFHYGDKVINPHPEVNDNPNLNESGSQIWLIRDVTEERRVLSILISSKFSERSRTKISTARTHAGRGTPNDTYHLYSEAAIYNFLKYGVETLREIADLYYSDRFAKLKISDPPRFNGKVRLESPDNLLSVSLDTGGLTDEQVRQVLQAYREKRRYTRLKNGDFIELPKHGQDQGLHVLETLDSWGANFEETNLTLPSFRALSFRRLLDSDKEGAKRFSTDEDFDKMVHNIEDPGQLEHHMPQATPVLLRPYQVAGFHWLSTLSHYGFGGILADEMGLGKTIQMLTFIARFHETSHLPSLVIVPTSLIFNWQSEAARFFPDLKVIVLEGSRAQRQALIEEISRVELVVVSYAVARQDIKELRTIDFGVCVLDEAQFIKNPITQTARAVKKIKASRRFALTGTPIENALSELWSIFDFLMPGFLFSHKEFQNNLEIPIVRDQDKDALEKLIQLTNPFILRRMKKDVLKELPDKIETELICEMNEDQKNLYEAYLAQARIKVDRLLADENENTGQKQIEILALLTRLRQICCHPALFLEEYQGGSGKLDSLNDQMDRLLSEGHRVLLFSQFTGMLSIIRETQKEQGRGVFYIDGSVSARERLDQVDRFNAGEGDLFLISLRAGGTGLNLTGADVVIHFDPWWNPAVEQQAADRAHRIGQENVVQVFRLITRGTIEEKIDELKERKSQLVDSVIQPNQNLLSKLSHSEILSLFE